MKRRNLSSINEIIIHHSGSNNDTPDSIRKYHLSKGWLDCGYHYIVADDGKGNFMFDNNIHCMRPISCIGAHCKGHNQNSIGVCVLGDYSNSTISDEMLGSLVFLIFKLKLIYPTIKKVSFHCDYANTSCPGSLVYLRDSLNMFNN